MLKGCQLLREVRHTRHSLLRGFFHGEGNAAADAAEHRQPRVHSVRLEAGSYAAGKALRELTLEAIGATVSVLRRIDTRMTSPPPETTLEEGDVLVLLGTGDQLEAAEIRLLRG